MKSIIAIPCFRESSRLPPFLDSLCSELATAPFPASVIIVDDGSGAEEAAKTRTIVDDARKNYPHLIADPVLLPENRGKGGAVYAGWAASSDAAAASDLLCFVDADGSVPAAEVRRLISEMLADECQHWGALFGSRIKLLGNDVSRVTSRHYIGRFFATLTSFISGTSAYDSQCGLKVLRRAAFAAIQKDLEEMRFVFDVELMVQLLERGFRIREIPINWHEVAGSKVRVVRDSIRMFTGLLRIRRRKAARAASAAKRAT